jgi:TonB family protein
VALLLSAPSTTALAQTADPIPSNDSPPHECTYHAPDAAYFAPTVLRFIITSQGKVLDARIAQSSGNAEADAFAIRCVSKWKYKPALENGTPTAQSWEETITWRPG